MCLFQLCIPVAWLKAYTMVIEKQLVNRIVLRLPRADRILSFFEPLILSCLSPLHSSSFPTGTQQVLGSNLSELGTGGGSVLCVPIAQN